MNLNEFRTAHSIVMEHYQYIEMHLEGIYAALSGKGLYEGLKEVERYNISRIIIMIQEQEKRHNKEVISHSEYEDLKSIYIRSRYFSCGAAPQRIAGIYRHLWGKTRHITANHGFWDGGLLRFYYD